MIRNFEYLILFTSAHGVLPEQNDEYRIQPRKVNEIKAYNKKRNYHVCAKLRHLFILISRAQLSHTD